MLVGARAPISIDLTSAIIRDPLVVSPNATVIDALTQMQHGRSRHQGSGVTPKSRLPRYLQALASCVVVVDKLHVIGLLTAHDIVRLIAQQQPLHDLVVQQVMTSPTPTLRESDFTDLAFTINLLQHFHSEHLPILDNQGHLAGLVTASLLQQLTESNDLVQLQTVSDVMTRDIIWAMPASSIQTIAQLMADYSVSSVVLAQPQMLAEDMAVARADGSWPPVSPYSMPTLQSGTASQQLTPISVVQAHSLVASYTRESRRHPLAEARMSPPPVVKPEAPLWTVSQLLERSPIDQVVVVGNQGELLGLITPWSWLRLFNASTLCQLATAYGQDINHLQAEKLALLENHANELERQVETRTAALKAKSERERLLAALTTQIRSSLSLQTILDTTVQQVRAVLKCDRVNVWQLEKSSSDGHWQARVVSESTDSPLSLIGECIDNHCIELKHLDGYRQGWIQVVPDIYTTPMTDHHRDVLMRQQTRAKILVPLLCGSTFWGILNACESQHPREWQPEDVELLQTLSMQLAIALLQATLHQRLQAELNERKRVEAALRHSEAHQRALIAALPDFLMRVSRQGFYLEFLATPNFPILGDLSTLVGAHVSVMLPPDVAQQRLEHIQRALQTKSIQIYEQDLSVDGLIQMEEVRVVPYSDDEVLLLVRDISDRKQAERAIKRSEAQNQAVLSAIPDLMFRVGADGVYRGYVTQHRELDILPSSINPVGQFLGDVLPAPIAKRHLHYIQQTLQTGQLQTYEQQVQIGDYQQYEEVRLVKSGDDEVLFMVRDITDYKHAEQQLQRLNQQLEGKVHERTIELQEREARFRALVEIIPDLMIRLRADGTHLDVIPGEGVRILDPERAYTGINIYDALPLECAQQRMFYVQQALQTQQVQVYDYEILIDGDLRSEEARIIAINDEEVLVIVQDITDRKRAKAQLQQTNEELARATRLKDEFLASMSHELRTPLNAILGMTEALQDSIFGNFNLKQLEALQTIERSGTHLLELINDILDVAKIEAGQVSLQYTPVEIPSLCQSSLAFIKQQAMKKRIRLILKLADNLPNVSLDERRIRQVLINLLNNAVKFTADGGTVTLDISRVLHTDTRNTIKDGATNGLRISVADTGIGIAPDHLSKLFQPFIQIDGALNRKYEGTGLGLALVKRIVELHGGHVEVTSQLGVGSCFTLHLPEIQPPHPSLELQPATSGSLPPGQPDVTVSPLILLAEDNEANIMTIAGYLEARGYRMLLARNGRDAIALAQTNSPSLILMDIQMPEMDGLEAIEQLRCHPHLATVPIIALTALAMVGDRERCIAAGANQYLSKPVKLKELVIAIQQFLLVRPPRTH